MKGELIHRPEKKVFKEREFKKNCAKYLRNEKMIKKLYIF